ncbi:MAG: DNA topoisomerase VI subunit B [Candidatus Aenigmarchaeota archaeon]|nr:DNA topoisomerase VI subunit B [Candidatus Aenigmarchaeota archaeon]
MAKTAEEMAKEQKEISVSEFFEKNKHLLGFDNPTKALLMAVKEACDNSLDACQDAGVLPDIAVKIKSLSEEKFRITVQDNGPGIVKEQIPRIFGKLLYGSKFHKRQQNRGQQGIGISAVLLYSQLTTGSPFRVWSKIASSKKVNYYELFINTLKNEPDIVKENILEDGLGEHGVKIEMELIGRYRKAQGPDDYLRQTSISNPFAKITYHAPDDTKVIFQRSSNELPKPPKEIKPHPYGVEFGILLRMLGLTKSKTLQSFLSNEFSSVGSETAKEICKTARLLDKKPQELTREEIEKLLNAMQKVKIQRPPLDCLSPIGKKELEKDLKKEYPNAELIVVETREPAVYRGSPFQIEIGIVYGGLPQDQQIEIVRIANRVPLLYQAGACATIEAAKDVDWKRYGLQQSANSLPFGPLVLVIHMCSTWVPFVSESKEAIAPYPEIVKEIKLAIQETSRELSRFLSGKRRAGAEKRRMQIFERYASPVIEAVSKLTEGDAKKIEKKFMELLSNRSKLNEFAKQESTEEKENENNTPGEQKEEKEEE